MGHSVPMYVYVLMCSIVLYSIVLYSIVISGTLSAWYVWSALGLYPLTGTPLYVVGSPSISNANITMETAENEYGEHCLHILHVLLQ